MSFLQVHSRLASPFASNFRLFNPSRTFATFRPLRQTPDKDVKVSANYTRPPAPRSRVTGSKLPVYPIIFIFVAGTVAFYQLAKSRQGQGSSHYVLPTRDNKSTREELYKKSS